MKINDKDRKVAEQTGFSPETVHSVYSMYWKMIRKYMQCQKLKSCESDDEFMKLRPNVNVTRLGKFYITLKTFKVTKEKDRKYTNKNVAHKEDKANVHEYRDDGGQV